MPPDDLGYNSVNTIRFLLPDRSSDLDHNPRLSFVGFDAVHLACAESGNADVFLSTDDRLLKRAKRLSKKIRVKVMNPLDWLQEMI